MQHAPRDESTSTKIFKSKSILYLQCRIFPCCRKELGSCDNEQHLFGDLVVLK